MTAHIPDGVVERARDQHREHRAAVRLAFNRRGDHAGPCPRIATWPTNGRRGTNRRGGAPPGQGEPGVTITLNT